MSEQWAARQVVAPFNVALPDGSVRVINQDYDLKNSLHTIDPSPLQRYSGLAPGDRIRVIGTVVRRWFVAGAQADAAQRAGRTLK